VVWNDAMYFRDRHAEVPDPDPEGYLRLDFESAAYALDAAGFKSRLLLNADCLRPVEGATATEADIRDLVIASIDEGRPVVALLSAASSRWAPEWSILTGYAEGGAAILGWSCLQDGEREREELDFEPDGTFRKVAWEPDVLAAVRIMGALAELPEDPDRKAVELGVKHSAAARAAYEAWAAAIEDEENGAVADEVLAGRLQYHGHFIGHLAAQKWFTSAFLKAMDHGVWSQSGLLHAAGHYARIHELLWDCWRIAGGYWRDPAGEIEKFRDPGNREAIAALIHEVAALDRSAVEGLESALEKWDKQHADYLAT
jgi:hypothetical protein